MATYAIGLTSLLDNLKSIASGTKHVAFADDLRKVTSNQIVLRLFTSQRINKWLLPKTANILCPCKTSLRTKELFSWIKISITVSGAKHLEDATGSVTFREDYIRSKVNSLVPDVH